VEGGGGSGGRGRVFITAVPITKLFAWEDAGGSPENCSTENQS